jgi:hypothetical protein
MGFFDIFRRPPAIRDADALAEFIDSNAAFLVQKGMYEYSRARAGHYAKVLMQEPEFLEAIEHARWQAYPLGIAMVAEMTEKLLYPHIADDRRAGVDAIKELALSVFDRYPRPQPFTAATWNEARQDLARRLDLIGLHPPKAVKDIPASVTQFYFDLMPIHQKLRAPDFLAISNYLRVSLINIHDRLIDRLDGAAVAQSLLAPPVDR